jgi:hypothetical protein
MYRVVFLNTSLAFAFESSDYSRSCLSIALVANKSRLGEICLPSLYALYPHHVSGVVNKGRGV